jgi:V/A-type H+-transporting ATPase subunit C
MPQKSMPYAIARTRVLENRLLSAERIQRLLEESTAMGMLRALGEYGYGGNAQGEDVRAYIDAELGALYDYIDRVTPNEWATGVLRLRHDCQNAKSALKARLLRREVRINLHPGGTIDAKTLQQAVREGDAAMLPSHMREAAQMVLERIDAQDQAVAVHWLECLLDAACFADMAAYAKNSGEDAAAEWVRARADLSNLVTLLRVKRADEGEEALVQALVPAGAVDAATFVAALDADEASLLTRLGLRVYEGALKPGLDALRQTGSFGLLERLCDDALTRMLRRRRYDREGIAPLLGYMLAKEREAQAVRLIYLCKRNGVPQPLIRERLREMYA